ncbi:MAG: XRE family transcriptional regulator [Rhodospirillales bacterium]|nr:MAG: XRE family transcriptional regulator [Rhodospirillales bacterium]
MSDVGPPAMDPIDARVAARLRQRRRVLGLNSRLLDVLIGEPPGTVARFESGRRRVGAAHLFRLSQALQTDVGYFFAEDDEDTGMDHGSDARDSPAAVTVDIKASPRLYAEAGRLAEAFAKVNDPEVRATVLALVKTLRDTGGR